MTGTNTTLKRRSSSLPVLNGKPYCRIHRRYAPVGTATCVLCESERATEIAARTLVQTPSFSGPDRRRRGLFECAVCERRFREDCFRRFDPRTGLPASFC